MAGLKSYVMSQWKPFAGGVLVGLAGLFCMTLTPQSDAQPQDVNPILQYNFRPVQPPFPPEGFPPPLLNPSLLSVNPNYAHYKSRTYSDRDIRTAIQNLFASDPFLHRFGIKVSVKDGVAKLTGWVDTLPDRDRAEADAYAAGAAEVDNQLKIRYKTLR